MVTGTGPHTAGTRPGTAPAAPPDLAELRALAGAVPDPELPVISLADLGVLRALRVSEDDGTVEVDLTPTYTGCPAVESMKEDVARVLRPHTEGRAVRVRTVLSPPWSTDDITPAGRHALAAYGIAPPRAGGARPRTPGPVPVALSPTMHRPGNPHPRSAPGADQHPAPRAAAGSAERAEEPVRCPQCGSADTVEVSRFSSSACLALRRCESCREPFDHLKEL